MPIDGAGLPLVGRIRPFFRSMGITASGLSAQRARIDTVASNLANAETTRTADGGPYRRRQVQLEEVTFPEILTGSEVQGKDDPTLRMGGVRVTGVAEDATEGPMVYDPGHPDADENGYVQYPNVSVTEEMVEMMEARRLYEANASVLQAVKNLLRRATQI